MRQRAARSTCLIAIALLACAPATNAQEEPSGALEVVVVTAERRLANIQSVPLSVVAMTDEDILSLTLRDTVDLSAAVPGLQLDQQGMGATPFIRGVGAMTGAIGNEAPVSMYVDGVYLATPTASVFGLHGIHQIEVLKGPQGTLFGRNATGGVIEIVTREPEADPSAEVQLQLASDDTVRGGFYATGGLSNSIAGSVSLYGREQKHGWGTNLATGEPTFRHREHGGRAKLLWAPAAQTEIRFQASRMRRRGEDGIGYHIVPGSLGLDGQTGYAGFYNAWADPQDRAGYRHTVVSTQLDHDFAAFRLVNIVAWQELDGFFNLDQDATPARIVNAPISQYGRTVTEELRILSMPDASLDWIAGFYYLNDLSAYDPLALEGAASVPFSSVEIHSRQRSDSYAVFGQATTHLTERMHLTVGGRYTRDERRITGRTLGILGTESSSLATAQQTAVWKKPTWRVAFAVDVTPDLMAYVSWDRGFKSGIYNLLAYAAAPANPEVLDAYQVGMKSDWLDNRLRLNVGAFTYRYENIQIDEIVTGATITINAAAAQMRGLDVELEYAPSSSFTVRAALALLHGRYTDFPNAPFNIPTRDSSGQLIGGNTVISGDATGFQTVRSPTRTGTLNARYRLHTSAGDVGLSVGYYHNSGFAWDPDNRLRQPAYGLLSASVDWTLPNEAVTVRVAGSNLNDAEVCLYSTATAPGDLCSPRAPRALSIDVSARF